MSEEPKNQKNSQQPYGQQQPKYGYGYRYSGQTGQMYPQHMMPSQAAQIPQISQTQQQPYPQAQVQSYPVPGFVQQQMAQQSMMPQMSGLMPLEQSYIENILRRNRGKRATVYMTFENNDRWNAMVFSGRVEEAGRDHIILSDPETGQYYILLMVNLDYIVFDEPLEYEYPFPTGISPTAQYPPR
ncbi:spore coat protein GerQ [Halalkalibacterium ligniniphilum]|uniref:spore coat protein GerQ n=1 Tax=Halalkalibacterium ligniniphilum TaxID=1134413 RepID=UPI00034878C3|nr:spore coat protein GerQ [Halalkalibacterium ligniniphilum]